MGGLVCVHVRVWACKPVNICVRASVRACMHAHAGDSMSAGCLCVSFTLFCMTKYV